MMQTNLHIGIMGLGIVGSALKRYYEEQGHKVFGYDKATGNLDDLSSVKSMSEVVFICVGTPYNPDTGMLDCTQVYAAVDALGDESKTVIIKSTVMPGTTDMVQETHPQHRVFFVPEFLSEVSAYEDYANPRRPHVVGSGGPNPLDEPWLVLLPDAYIDGCAWYCRCLPAHQAELLKLATNAFYAMKVTFANQMYDLGMTQETLDALAADPWIAASHFQVQHKDYRGYAGKCLLKDTKALAQLANRPGRGNIVHTTDRCNVERLREQGIDEDTWL